MVLILNEVTGSTSTSRAASSPLATATNKQTAGSSKSKKPHKKKERKPTSTSTISTQPAPQKRRTQAREAVKRQALSAPRTKKKYEKDPLVRKAALEADVWTAHVRPASLWCLGCGREFQLDKRGSSYYQYNWNRHKRRCKGILRGEKAKVPPSEASNNSEDDRDERDEDVDIVDEMVIASEELLDQPPQSPSPSQENSGLEHADPDFTASDDERDDDDDCATGQTTHLGLRTMRRQLPVMVYDPGNYAPYTPRTQAGARTFSFTLRPTTFTDAEIDACAVGVDSAAPNAIGQQNQPAIVDWATPASTGPSFYRGDRRELLNPVVGEQATTNDVSAGVAMLRAFQRRERMGARLRDGWIGLRV